MNQLKSFHSCYIVDVKIYKEFIVLEDSSRCKYYIDLIDKEAIASFKIWFDKFKKGVSLTLTVFEYESRSPEEGVADLYIKKIFV